MPYTAFNVMKTLMKRLTMKQLARSSYETLWLAWALARAPGSNVLTVIWVAQMVPDCQIRFDFVFRDTGSGAGASGMQVSPSWAGAVELMKN